MLLKNKGIKLRNIHQRGEEIFQQGELPFRYECKPTDSGMTALAGLTTYLELAIISGSTGSIQGHLGILVVLLAVF